MEVPQYSFLTCNILPHWSSLLSGLQYLLFVSGIFSSAPSKPLRRVRPAGTGTRPCKSLRSHSLPYINSQVSARPHCAIPQTPWNPTLPSPQSTAETKSWASSRVQPKFCQPQPHIWWGRKAKPLAQTGLSSTHHMAAEDRVPVQLLITTFSNRYKDYSPWAYNIRGKFTMFMRIETIVLGLPLKVFGLS